MGHQIYIDGTLKTWEELQASGENNDSKKYSILDIKTGERSNTYIVETLPEPIDWFRPNNDSNGNPRYVCHFLEFITDKDREQAGYNISDGYNIALARAKKLGGRKFHNKKYGGGIVFQSYNISTTEKDIQELMKQYL